jgi:hypothetical protein
MRSSNMGYPHEGRVDPEKRPRVREWNYNEHLPQAIGTPCRLLVPGTIMFPDVGITDIQDIGRCYYGR